MQVERQHSSSNTVGGEWRTGEEYIGICPVVGDNPSKGELIPHDLETAKRGIGNDLARLERPMSD